MFLAGWIVRLIKLRNFNEITPPQIHYPISLGSGRSKNIFQDLERLNEYVIEAEKRIIIIDNLQSKLN